MQVDDDYNGDEKSIIGIIEVLEEVYLSLLLVEERINAMLVSGLFNGIYAVGECLLLDVISPNHPQLHEDKGPDKKIGMRILNRC